MEYSVNLTPIQRECLQLCIEWCATHTTPISRRQIIKSLKVDARDERGEKAIARLLKTGYLRKAVRTSNQVHYVLIRTR